jgi:hypothetical protein
MLAARSIEIKCPTMYMYELEPGMSVIPDTREVEARQLPDQELTLKTNKQNKRT